MPIDTTTGLATAAKLQNTVDGQPTGVVRAEDFAICDNTNSRTQVKFDLSGLTTDAITTVTPAGIVSASIEVPLSFHAGASTTVTTSAPVSMRLRRVGDVVFCQIDAFTAPSFEGTTGQSIKSQADSIPTEYLPLDDDLAFTSVLLDPSQAGCWSAFNSGYVEFFKDAAFNGFTNGAVAQSAAVTALWITGALDAE